MAVYEQLPGELGLQLKRGDHFSTDVDFNPTDLTGYSVTASLSSAVTGEEVLPLTVAVTDALAGRVNISMTSSQTASIQPGTYAWSMKWDAGGSKRTALAGFVEVVK